MNTDIRISTSFLNHRKRKKLKQILGPGSTDYLIDLWINTAINRPKGILYDMDKGDIALDAGWEGKADYFVDVLLQVGFLDYDGESFRLHDWDKHQSWAVNADERADQARKAANARWGCKEHADSKEVGQCVEHADSIKSADNEDAGSNPPILSSPNQPKPKKKDFTPDSTEIRLSQLLLSKIKGRNPDHKTPDTQKWAKQIDFMIRLDGRDPQKIANIIGWCQTDDFWQNNILSTSKLRKHYDALSAKMNSKKGKASEWL